MIENARAGGRSDVEDYLALRAANDAIRQAGTKWLFDSMIEIAAGSNRERPPVTIEREEPHSFDHRGANIVGSMLRLRQGLRCLTLEAGWTRTPSDGFMRGGALAVARVSHFGFPGATSEIVLVNAPDQPFWNIFEDGRLGPRFGETELRSHFRLLTAG